MLEAKDENGTIAATNAVTCAATGAGASQRPPSPHSDYTRRSGSSRGGEADSAHGSDGVDEEEDNALGRFSTRQSLGPDAVMEPVSSVIQIPEEFYDRLPPSRKVIILVLVSYCAFLAPISSTSVLAATPEVAAEYATNGSIINLVNALYMLFMGVSPILWGPLSQVYGRRLVRSPPLSDRFDIEYLVLASWALDHWLITGPMNLDHNSNRRGLPSEQHRNGAGAEPRGVLCVSHPDRLGGHILSAGRLSHYKVCRPVPCTVTSLFILLPRIYGGFYLIRRLQ